MTPASCRFCSAPLRTVFADLGMSPLANSYVAPERAGAMEPFYPLCALVCGECMLVQLEEFETPEAIFSDYAYFSSYSTSWLEHSRRYVEQMIERWSLDGSSHVVELASNDGYLLQYFVARGVSVLGIEPAANVAEVALENGVPTLVEFFGVPVATQLAAQRRADLLLGNNVLAHVPDLNDFVAGMKVLLAPDGVITMEFPHLLRLIEDNQYDTIYHEHFSYLSLLTAQRVLAAAGLTVVDIEELPTHGGSMRLWSVPTSNGSVEVQPSVARVLDAEAAAGLDTLEGHKGFAEQVATVRNDFVEFLVACQRAGRRVAGYGAPGKGNTLLNHCGIRSDLIEFTVDRNPHKHGMFLPGTHIPIHPVERLAEERPDFVVIMPWNLRAEITNQLTYIRNWGGQFVVSLPRLEVF
jgi:SAM-dependent methyltransferase